MAILLRLGVKRLIHLLSLVIDIFLIPFIILSALPFKLYRRLGAHRFSISTRLFRFFGVFPIRDHYYETQFVFRNNSKQIENRNLPGIDLNINSQLSLLRDLNFSNELRNFKWNSHENRSAFKLGNGNFESGDAEFLYQFIRLKKPSKIVEIGAGHSSLIIAEALNRNKAEGFVQSSHICIEPYEMKWLDRLPNIQVIRERVENIDLKFFLDLNEGDLLFIDSSHKIRPDGDILFEYLQVLPSLKNGVFIHIHDIFTPLDYPESWIKQRLLFWDEQYVLEALLSNSKRYEIVAALNFLKQNYFKKLKDVCPYLTKDREPGSIYLKISNDI